MNPFLQPTSSRRRFLAQTGFGLGATALAWLLDQQGLLGQEGRPELVPQSFDLRPRPPHHPARARAMISLFMQGGPSHIDLLDPKPVLSRLDGGRYPGEVQYDNAAQASPRLLGSPWRLRRHGQSGTEVSELLPHLASIVDDITVIRSMRTGVSNHGQSIWALHNGRAIGGRPTVGSWLAYGLGAENQNLPAYVALPDPVSLPVLGVENWSNGWLPSLFQATVVRAREPRILNLDPPPSRRGQAQQQLLGYLEGLNRDHLRTHPGELDLDARIATFELAARMQTSAREALDLLQESAATKQLYGLNDPATADFGARCLIARRLVERGVRFVQVFTRDQYWDHHGQILRSLPAACRTIDQPAAALVKDLKARGLLETTLVHWGGEMGRLPVIQNDTGRDQVGRDHNTSGFSLWLAGGGIRGGHVHGATDEFGHHAVRDIVTHNDFHATVLHLFGLDHRRLVFPRAGREQSLTDGQACRVVEAILA
jgi:hypothetical protein